MPHLNRDGVNIYYEDHGRGMPILLTHGFSASAGMWRGQVEAFQEQYRLIPWDMRGHGESDSPEDQTLYSQDGTVEDMRALLDRLDIESAVIGGHSLGGFLSLRFRVKYPERVRALVLQGCGPGFRNPEARAKWNETAEQRAQVLEQKGLGTLKGGSEVGVSTQRSAAGLARASRGILAQVDAQVIDSLPHVDVPVLIIAGDGDKPFLTGTHYMASRIPNAVEKIIADAGHGANVDQPEVFNETLGSFLRQLEGS